MASFNGAQRQNADQEQFLVALHATRSDGPPPSSFPRFFTTKFGWNGDGTKELTLEVFSAVNLSLPKRGLTGAITSLLGGGLVEGEVFVAAQLGGRRPLATLPVSAHRGQADFARAKLTFKCADEGCLVLRVFFRETGESPQDVLLGEGELTLNGAGDAEVCLNRGGSVSCRASIAPHSSPVTCGPALLEEALSEFDSLGKDAQEKVLSTFGVNMGTLSSDAKERANALFAALDMVEKQRARDVEKLFEKEQQLDPMLSVEEAEAPEGSFFSKFWPFNKKDDDDDADEPESVIPQIFVRFDTTLVEPWVKKRFEIKKTCLAMADDLDACGTRLTAMGILASLSGVSSSGLQLVAFASAALPAAAPLAAYQTAIGIAAASTGLGEGVMNFAKTQALQVLDERSEETVFRLVAEENALHRQLWQGLRGYARTPDAAKEVEDLLGKAKKGDSRDKNALEELFNVDVDVDDITGKDGTLAHVTKVKGFLGKAISIASSVRAGVTAEPSAFGSANAAVGLPVEFTHLFSAARDVTTGKKSDAGIRLRKIAERVGFSDNTVQEAVARVLSAPLKCVSPAPSGVVMFDVADSTRAVRMGVVSRHTDDQQPVFFDQCTPVTLRPHQSYEIFFQVSLGLWVDVQKWNRKAKTFANPKCTHTFRVDGSRSFRWFHLKGPYPIRVENLENEHGPMWK